MAQNKNTRPPQNHYDLSVVVPCYNEGSRVKESLNSIYDHLKKADHIHIFEIIAVNDGSPDDTLQELEKVAKKMPELRIISYKKNQGKGYAVKKGVLKAKGDFVAYIDGDGEIHPEHLVKYFHFAKYGKFDVVLGSKTHPLSNSKFSFIRKVLSTGYRMINGALFKLHVKDTQVGVKLFTQAVAQRVFPLVQTKGYAFDIEFLFLANHMSYTIFEAPVEIAHQGEKSSVGMASVIQAFFDTLRIRGQITQTVKFLEQQLDPPALQNSIVQGSRDLMDASLLAGVEVK